MNPNDRPPPPFAQQRLICLALLLGMVSYAMVVAVMVVQTGNKGMAAEYIFWLDIALPSAGVVCAAVAVSTRRMLSATAEPLFGTARGNALFRAILVPLAVTEGGCLFGVTAWLFNASVAPLVTTVLLLSLSIWLMPFRDPDARI